MGEIDDEKSDVVGGGNPCVVRRGHDRVRHHLLGFESIARCGGGVGCSLRPRTFLVVHICEEFERSGEFGAGHEYRLDLQRRFDADDLGGARSVLDGYTHGDHLLWWHMLGDSPVHHEFVVPVADFSSKRIDRWAVR